MSRTDDLRVFVNATTTHRQTESMRGGSVDPADFEGASDQEKEIATEALERVQAGAPLDPAHQFVTEAIIIPNRRPAALIQDDDYTLSHSSWVHLNSGQEKTNIRAAVPAIGRIELPDNFRVPYGGTGFVVAQDLIMTNRHVAELFIDGVGETDLTFRPGQTSLTDFKREHASVDSLTVKVKSARMVHPYWDMALLEISVLPDHIVPVTLSTEDPEAHIGREVAVIGYPAFDPRNDADVQNRVFKSIYDVKRLQPGVLRQREWQPSYGGMVNTVTHDASTLGGNSGSAVLDIATGEIVALHFAGRYLQANYAVPAFELSRDRRIVAAGVNFGDTPDANLGTAPEWEDAWSRTGFEQAPAAVQSAVQVQQSVSKATLQQGHASTWTIPLEITVRIGGDACTATPATPAGSPPDAGGGTERMVEPFRERNYDNRTGYDQDFLDARVPFPTLTKRGTEAAAPLRAGGGATLAYHNFSLVMHAERRVAMVTAAMVDATEAARRPEPGRDYSRDGLNGFTSDNDREKWFPDPRIDADHQLSDRFFNQDRTAFDKGHLVRRDAVAFGATYRQVQAANGDTFHITNCSPQVKGFNRSNLGGLWGKLENEVLRRAEGGRCVVMSGPILKDDDPVFHGVTDDGQIQVRIPRAYWKLIVAVEGAELMAHAFHLTQDLSQVRFEEFQVSPAWEPHLTTLKEIEAEARFFTFDEILHGADVKTNG